MSQSGVNFTGLDFDKGVSAIQRLFTNIRLARKSARIKRCHFAGGDLTHRLFKYCKGDGRPLWKPHNFVPASRGGANLEYTRDTGDEMIEARWHYAVNHIDHPPYIPRKVIIEILKQRITRGEKGQPDPLIDNKAVKELNDAGFFREIGLR